MCRITWTRYVPCGHRLFDPKSSWCVDGSPKPGEACAQTKYEAVISLQHCPDCALLVLGTVNTEPLIEEAAERRIQEMQAAQQGAGQANAKETMSAGQRGVGTMTDHTHRGAETAGNQEGQKSPQRTEQDDVAKTGNADERVGGALEQQTQSIQARNWEFVVFGDRFACPYASTQSCTRTFGSKTEAEHHGQTHLGNRLHCSFCDEMFPRRAHLEYHERADRLESIRRRKRFPSRNIYAIDADTPVLMPPSLRVHPLS